MAWKPDKPPAFISVQQPANGGHLTARLGSLTNLQFLDLSDNQLTGGIPPALGGLMNLGYLYLRSNNLTGAIPVSLTNLTSLFDGNSDLRWNALYTTDNTLRNFLNIKQSGGDWESTQTITPTNFAITAVTSNFVTLTWTPIAYTADAGGYEILQKIGGTTTWTNLAFTANKTVDNWTAILIPGTKYEFKIRAVTTPHGNNQNTVYK